MDKNFQKEFNQCPNCGSDQRFCGQLAQELKERGLARPEWSFNYDVRNGVVMDGKYTQIRILAGATLPGFLIHTDICMDCGTIYAVRIARLEGEMKPAPKVGPIPPQFNNPMAS